MNKQRRAAIVALVEQLGPIRAELENLRDEEQEYLDNMPESLQGGGKGEAAEEAIGKLDEMIQHIEDIEGESFD